MADAFRAYPGQNGTLIPATVVLGVDANNVPVGGPLHVAIEPVAGTITETIATKTIVAGALAIEAFAANSAAKTRTLYNIGGGDAWWGYTSAVTDATGMPLYAGGGGFAWSLGEVDPRAIYVYSVGGTTLRVKEGV